MLLSFYQALLQVGILLLFLFFDVGEDADGYESFYLYSVVFSNVALALAVSLSGCSLVSRLGALLHHRARDVAAAVAAEEGTRVSSRRAGEGLRDPLLLAALLHQTGAADEDTLAAIAAATPAAAAGHAAPHQPARQEQPSQPRWRVLPPRHPASSPAHSEPPAASPHARAPSAEPLVAAGSPSPGRDGGNPPALATARAGFRADDASASADAKPPRRATDAVRWADGDGRAHGAQALPRASPRGPGDAATRWSAPAGHAARPAAEPQGAAPAGPRAPGASAAAPADPALRLLREARFRVAVIQWTVSVLLLLKSFLFVMRPLFGIVLTGEVGAVAYPWFFYTVPELVSGCLVLALTSPHGKDGTRDDGDDPKGCRRQVVACLAACLPTCCIECGFAVGGCCDWLLRSCCCCCCCAPDGADSGPGAELASLERSATRLRGPFGERLLWRLAASEGRDMLELVMRTGPSLSARDEAAAAQPTHRDDGRIALLADDELGHPTAGRGVAAPIADERCAAGWV